MEVTPCNLENMFAVRESQYTCTVASRRAPSRGRVQHPARHPSRPSFLCCPAPPSTQSTTSSSLSPSSSSRSSSSSTASLAIHRLCRALVVSACVLSVARLPTVMSAPTGSAGLSELKASHPRWLTPCGEAQPDPNPGDLAEHGDVPDASSALGNLQVQVHVAIGEGAHFLEDFVSTEKSKEVFHGNSEIENDFKDKKYPWLPELPQMDEGLPPDHFNGLEVGEALRTAFTNMQRFAVGLEQIVWDRKNDGNALAEKFRKAEDQLRLVLCELMTAMQQMSVALPESVSRDIMEDAVRMEPGDARDWIIYRDYVNALKYTDAVIKHFKKP